MTDQKRRYRKARRAELEAQTRQQITESAVELHRTLGPANTTVSAIAEHAGVRRSTVYRHFPDQEQLFAACSAHWIAAHPLPDVADWQAIEDPEGRLRSALAELYAYYRQGEDMLDRIYRDAEVPLVHQMLGAFREYLANAHDALMAGRQLEPGVHRMVSAAVGHALAFRTWQSLSRDQGLDDEESADLMTRMVTAVSAGSSPVSGGAAPDSLA